MRGHGSTSGAPPKAKGAILLEIVRLGSSLKVTAVDEASGVEASFVAPSGTPRSDIEQLAKSKLRYILAKKNGSQ